MLDKLLETLGVKKIEDLTEEERALYRQWSHILAKPDTTIQDLKALLPKELDRAHEELRKFDNSEKRQMFYAAYSEFCLYLTKIIITPAQERDTLRTHLKQKFNLE